MAALSAAAALAAGICQAQEAPPHRTLLFIGGPTLSAWSRVSPDLFAAKGKATLIATDAGTARAMHDALDRALPGLHADAAMILPESGLGGESLAETEGDLDAMRAALQAKGTHVVLAAPLHIGAAAAPAQDAALIAWMRKDAEENGAVFGDFREAKLGAPSGVPPLPLDNPKDLLARTALLRSALDLSFHARAGLAGPALMASLKAERNATPETRGSGPYPAVRVIEPALPSHTFYRPANLAPFVDHKMPVLLFGNGGCSNDSGDARPLLTEIASHGYLVIAPGFMKSGPAAFPKPAAPGAVPLGGTLGTSLADLERALDWVTKPDPAGAAWQKFIDPSRVAVAGWSCGGVQALKLGADRRITTEVIFDSGIFNPGTFGIPGLPIAKSDLGLLHGAVLYLLGGQTDVAYGNGADDFSRISQVPAVLMARDVGHGGTFWQKDGGAWAKAAVAWLDWHLRDDAAAKQDFVGQVCGFCRDPGWTITVKGY